MHLCALYKGMRRPFYKWPRISGDTEHFDEEKMFLEKPLSILKDGVFKAMLTAYSEDSREALRSLLSACTHREIIDFQVINNDLNPAHLAAKTSRLDVHVIFNDGEIADLEMQVQKTNDDLKARAEVYAAVLLSAQTKKGSRYKDVKRVYQIFFLNCILFPQSKKLSRRYSYREEEEHDRLSDITEIIFYELPKLRKRVWEILKGKVSPETLSGEEKWCIYMKYRHEKRVSELIRELCHEEEGIMYAEKVVTKVSRDYLKYAREVAEIKNRMDRASEEYYTGVAEGKTAGYKQANIEIAQKMKAAGRPIKEIAEFTGLSAETIANL